MRRCTSTALAVLLTAVVIPHAHAQWATVNGPYGGFIRSFTVTDQVVLAGTASGFYATTNAGRVWTEANTGLYPPDVYSLTFDGTDIFAGTLGSGVLRSTDHGQTWTATSSEVDPEVQSVLSSGNILLAGTASGIFRSTNDGDSWLPGGLGATTAAFAASGPDFYAGTYGIGVWISTTGGNGWSPTSMTSGVVTALAANGSSIFAGTPSGLFRTMNKGITWEVVNSGLGSTDVRAILVDGTDLYVGTWGGGVFRSTDNGSSWVRVASGLVNSIVQALAVDGEDLFAGTYGGGVFRSSDDGARWKAASRGITDVTTLGLLVHGDRMYAGTDGGVYVSPDNGKSWELARGLENASGSDFVAIGSTVFAATSRGVFRSADDGTTWTRVSNGLPPLAVYAMTARGTNLFASIPGEGVYLSENNGDSWVPVNNGLSITFVWALASSGSSVFAGTGGGGVYRSTDDGESWTPVNNGMQSLFVYSLGVHGTTIFAGTAGVVYRSVDNGSNWTIANTGMGNITAYSFTSNGTDLIAGAYQLGTYRSTDDGSSWEPFGLSGLIIHSLTFNGPHLFAGVEGGIQRTRVAPPTNLLTVVREGSPASAFALEQNYPNPFNPTTTIEFSLPEASNVTLSVFGMNGAEVAMLVNGQLEAGVHRRIWDAAKVASGVYFYKLTVGDGYSSTKRLILLR